MKRKIPHDIEDRALADYLDGADPTAIRERYKLSKSDVNNIRFRRGYPSQRKMREWRLWDRACQRAAS